MREAMNAECHKHIRQIDRHTRGREGEHSHRRQTTISQSQEAHKNTVTGNTKISHTRHINGAIEGTA